MIILETERVVIKRALPMPLFALVEFEPHIPHCLEDAALTFLVKRGRGSLPGEAKALPNEHAGT